MALACGQAGRPLKTDLDSPSGQTTGRPFADSDLTDSGSGLGADRDRPGADATAAAADPFVPVTRSPRVMHTPAQLAAMRSRIGREPWLSAYNGLIAEADTAMDRIPAPPAVLDIPFYYGDPAASDAAKADLQADSAAAYALALASWLAPTTEESTRYADKAISILDAWATINRQVSGADGDLVLTYKGVLFIYAADLLWDREPWMRAGRTNFESWVRVVYWPAADRIKTHANNWGDWGTLGAVASAALLDDRDAVLQEIERIKERIASNIATNGELPYENLRTNSGMWYTFFALTSMTTAAQVALNYEGVNLFTYTADNGRTFKMALDKYFGYSLHPETWPYPLPAGIAGEAMRLAYPCADEILQPTPNTWPGTLYEMMSFIYGQPDWAAWVAPYRPLRGFHGWIYSTLMREAL
jgi:hypothetical protein